jgi:serine/threonine-protein kinase
VLLGKYLVEDLLGVGGMGLVVRAHHMQLNEKVAIKTLRDDIPLESSVTERFLREAKAAVKLKSEHVARISDIGTFDDGRPYMVMELLEGLDLARMLIERGPLEPSAAIDLVLQACEALAEAHGHGIVHRDVKPNNLFVSFRRDGEPVLKVLDFGISKAPATDELSLTQTSSVLGTPTYMSPEQMRSARFVDPRTDIWSLGAVLYELIEGVPPFVADNFAELCVKVTMEPPRPMRAAPVLQPIIARCLAKNLDERFANVAEVAEALVPFSFDPARAAGMAARVRRMVTIATNRTDATPSPLAVRISAGNISGSMHPETAAAREPERKRISWLAVLGFLALLGGAAALVVLMASGDAPPPSSSTVKMNATTPQPGPATGAGSAAKP